MDVCLSNSKEKCADWGTAFKQPVESTLLGRIQGGCEVEPLRTCFEPALLPSSLPPWPLPVPPGMLHRHDVHVVRWRYTVPQPQRTP
eukprot:1160859-Pelagomonas_calceolata.AAC.1